ncbi:MAG: hypothetical protein A3E85_02800 [Gammaproteobacteria bacterium RIFCSPHIGHO2_12_FULL_45_12]|nr:MAG: hypothetical protein A3E85_02800 [Gammaproteobacteria bacterium RIFCSPHIGHO2_12_FULL_45_12]
MARQRAARPIIVQIGLILKRDNYRACAPAIQQPLVPAIPAKKRGKAALFPCCAKATLLLAPKRGENRDLPLWNPPSRHVERESLLSFAFDGEASLQSLRAPSFCQAATCPCRNGMSYAYNVAHFLSMAGYGHDSYPGCAHPQFKKH